jgi:hypothetical protein
VTIELLSQPRNRHGAGRHAVRAEPDGAQSQCAERGKIPDEYSTNSSLPCLVRAGQRLHQPPDRWPAARVRFAPGESAAEAAGAWAGAGWAGPRLCGGRGRAGAPSIAELRPSVAEGHPSCAGLGPSGPRRAQRPEHVPQCAKGVPAIPDRGCGNPPPCPGFLGYPPDRGSRNRGVSAARPPFARADLDPADEAGAAFGA